MRIKPELHRLWKSVPRFAAMPETREGKSLPSALSWQKPSRSKQRDFVNHVAGAA
jgi:hypothetical protein